MNIEIKRIEPTIENLYEIELLRHQVFHLKTDDNSIRLSYSIFHALHNRLIPFALYLNGDMAAGVYVSCYGNDLFIDHLFVKEEYQNTGLKLGRRLLNTVLELKPIFEKHFGKEISLSRLTPNNDKSRSIYEKIGYERQSNTPYMIKHI